MTSSERAAGPLVAVVDIGTGSVRAHVVDADGGVVAQASRPTRVQLGAGTAEVDPDALWSSACSALREALARVDPRRIAAVAAASALGYVLLDGNGDPVGAALLYMDRRATDEAREIARRASPQRLYALGGRRLDPELLAPKLSWIRRRQPDRWAAIRTFVGLKDDTVRRLTGAIGTDPSHAAYSLLYDVERREWSEELLDAAAVPRSMVPPLRRAADIAGHVTAGAAAATGLPAGTPVVTGAPDGTAACLAAGGGTAVNVSGSTDVVMAPSDRPVRDPRERTVVSPHPVGDGWLVGGVMGTTGAALRWLVDLAYADVPEPARLERAGADAASAGAGAGGLVCLPALAGERAPRWNPAARGVVLGLDLRHGRGHLVRAVLEGVAFQVADVLDALRGLGVDVRRLRVVGGGAASELWNQIRADVTGLPVERPREIEGTVTGAAYLAMRGVGLVAAGTGADTLAPPSRAWAPGAERHERYRRFAAVADRVYASVAPVFEALAELRDEDGGGGDR
jgi:xylulokinase